MLVPTVQAGTPITKGVRHDFSFVVTPLVVSPAVPTRSLPWSGTLRGRPTCEIAEWVRDWDPYRAVVGLSVINAAINTRDALPESIALKPANGFTNLAVFEHVLPRLARF